MTEADLIEKYLKTLPRPDVLVGIGDDAAVLATPERLVMALDSLVVDKHFHTDDDPADVGYKSLAVNLSDLAAMGCTPCWAMLSLSVPPVHADPWIRAFARGFLALAERWDVSLIGGDLVAGPLVVTVQVTGKLVGDATPLLRSGAQAGDAIYISGDVGAAGVAWHRGALLGKDALARQCRERLLHPEPRVAEGRVIAAYATAAVDISDGVLLDLLRLTRASGVGADLDLDAVPVHPAAAVLPENDWLLPFTAGDDYELLFAMPAAAETDLRTALQRQQLATRLTRVGSISETAGLRCSRNGRQLTLPAVIGFDHFGAQIV